MDGFREKTAPWCVYILAADEVGRCKIGVSSRCVKTGRARSIQPNSPVLLRVHAVHVTSYARALLVEREVLRLVGEARGFGEWIACGPDVLDDLVVGELAKDRDFPKVYETHVKRVLHCDFWLEACRVYGFTDEQAYEFRKRHLRPERSQKVRWTEERRKRASIRNLENKKWRLYTAQ